MEEKNRALAEEKAELETQAHTLRGQSGGSKEEIEGYIAKRNELEARSSKLRLMERAKSAEREKLSGELARLEERKAAMRKEYDETVNKLYDRIPAHPPGGRAALPGAEGARQGAEAAFGAEGADSGAGERQCQRD